MAKKRSPRLTVVEPKVETIIMARYSFQALHGAARSVFREAIKSDNHSAESLVYLQLLDRAIDEGHQALGTQRPFADQYINIVSGLTQVQVQNAKKILENEGLFLPDLETIQGETALDT